MNSLLMGEVRASPWIEDPFFLGLCGLILLGFGVFMIVWTFREQLTQVQLREKGRLVQATITGKRAVAIRGGPNYYVTYSYQCEGSRYSRKQRLFHSAQYNSLPKGAKAEIRCLPERPETARLVDGAPGEASLMGVTIIGTFIATCGSWLVGLACYLAFAF